jgi:hypothetical protein
MGFVGHLFGIDEALLPSSGGVRFSDRELFHFQLGEMRDSIEARVPTTSDESVWPLQGRLLTSALIILLAEFQFENVPANLKPLLGRFAFPDDAPKQLSRHVMRKHFGSRAALGLQIWCVPALCWFVCKLTLWLINVRKIEFLWPRGPSNSKIASSPGRAGATVSPANS